MCKIKFIIIELTQIWFAHSPGQIGAACDVVEVLGLHLFLVGLSVIEVIKVRYDDGNWQSDREDTSDCTKRADDFTPNSDRPNEKVIL